MIDVFIQTNTPIDDIANALSGFAAGSRVQVRNGGPTELWVHTPSGWEKEQPGMILYESLSPKHIEFFGYVTEWGFTKPIDARSLRLTENEAKEWLTSMERRQYLLEDGIGCSINMDVDDHVVTCAVVTIALSEFKQYAIQPGGALNDKILAWAGDMLKAGADAIDICIALPR
ncbi:hypothetical protein [Aeromonas caviae]|uniref:Uncharacterized protein n=1 Tax=Aeromonas caviae TaxID=648 RepID=A0AAJ6CTW9_AERCA|nr:hypothetical protein [Aeromonas caviae]WFG00296.1 hypothetical protein P5S46_21275 [Aeromonas caviae]